MLIKILSDDLVNKIAAGEVVERPASVVKELVENAIDAGAANITIDVVDGGRTLVSVVDDGAGMIREDLEKSIMRHATSKLLNDDLLNINFMGFRGEALPSISSVSETTIETNGMLLDCRTGRIKPSAFSAGCRVRVRNLFGDIPARLKFLRSDRVEMMAVADVVKRLALARPDIGFVFNNKSRYKAGEPLSERFTKVAGDDTVGRMIAVKAEDGDIRLSGFVSAPTLRRASGADQYLFVNGRPVRDKVLVGALRAAYFDVMHAREYPLCCLYLELPPNQVDVNVSPAKTDVHFLEPSRIRDFIVRTVRRLLAAPAAAAFGGEWPREYKPAAAMPAESFFLAESGPPLEFQIPDSDGPLGRAVLQIDRKYIISEALDGLIIIDQHAAHERIVYEKLRKGSILRQPLLIPEIIKLRPEQASAVLEIKAELLGSGLAVESFGDAEVAVYEKPADFDLNWGKCLADMADEILADGHSSNLLERLHLKLADHACRHSVRAGQKLSLEQMNALLRDVEKTERGAQCNHGRPVWKKLTNSELDAMFERS